MRRSKQSDPPWAMLYQQRRLLPGAFLLYTAHPSTVKGIYSSMSMSGALQYHIPQSSFTSLSTFSSSTLLCRPSFALPSRPFFDFSIALRQRSLSPLLRSRSALAAVISSRRLSASAFARSARLVSVANGCFFGRFIQVLAPSISVSSCSCLALDKLSLVVSTLAAELIKAWREGWGSVDAGCGASSCELLPCGRSSLCSSP